MKYILFFLLLISIISRSQRPITEVNIRLGDAQTSSIAKSDSVIYRHDTTRVIMIVSDTSTAKYFMPGEDEADSVEIFFPPLVLWQFGYIVKMSVRNSGNLIVFDGAPRIKYLDEDKKVMIGKIVWVSREINQ